RDLDEAYARIRGILERCQARGVDLLVLPEACLGGYLANLDGADVPLPPALDLDGPELARVVAMAGDVTITLGICESDGARRFNTAVALTGDGVIAVHRKVHQPLREDLAYARGEGFEAFDSPVGRLGMMVCYDKAFPEAARALALDGAEVLAVLSAWPVSRTDPHPDLSQDRWTLRHNLFDAARALENQVVVVSANQTGTFGQLRFAGHAKIVGPGGDTLAATGLEEGLAVATLDLPASLTAARRGMFHLPARRPETYGAADRVSA
ncbi:MAG: carbon-nitrogen hydrolase family protein, partial [Pseudorhodobacter sp.]|nr:carbon-nitrogen hydrolase family protein [Frankiaceae bacterium]